MSAPRNRRRPGATTQHIHSLEQHAEELAAQLRLLQVQNQNARQREHALSAICAATRFGVEVAEQFGDTFAGALAPVSSLRCSTYVTFIGKCIEAALKDLPSASQAAATTPSSPLRWPRNPHTPLAQQLADGGPLALLVHCLGLLQRYPQQFGWVQRQTPETSRDMLYLIQGVIQHLHNLHPVEGSPGVHNSSINGSSSRSGSGRGRGSASSMVAPALAAAAARSVVAAAAAGGGRALGCTLAFLEVAGMVHDALLEQQQAQQAQEKGQGQQGQGEGPAADGGSRMPAQQQLVEAWAQALLDALRGGCWDTAAASAAHPPPAAAAAPASPTAAGAAAAAAGGGGQEVAALSDVDCALLGVVLGFHCSMMLLLVSDPGWIMELGAASMRPLTPAQLQKITYTTALSQQQVRDVLWVAALYRDLRKPYWEDQHAMEGRVGDVLARILGVGPAAAAAAAAPELDPTAAAPFPPAGAAAGPTAAEHFTAAAAAAAAAAGSTAAEHFTAAGAGAGAAAGASTGRGSSSGSSSSSGGGELGGGSAEDHLQLKGMCVQLQARARVNFWWEALQFSHVWGLLSLRQVSAFIVSMAPGTPSPVCWSLRLLLALLNGQASWVAAAAAASAEINGPPQPQPGRYGRKAATRNGAKGKGRGRGKGRVAGRQPDPQADMPVPPSKVEPWEALPPVAIPARLLERGVRVNGAAADATADDVLPPLDNLCAAAAPAAAPPAAAAAAAAEPGGWRHQGDGPPAPATPPAAAAAASASGMGRVGSRMRSLSCDLPSACLAWPTKEPPAAAAAHSLNGAAHTTVQCPVALAAGGEAGGGGPGGFAPAPVVTGPTGHLPLHPQQQWQEQQQQSPDAGAPFSTPLPPGGLPGAHPGGWMAWLAGPSGPLGRDAPALMPLVAAAHMSAANAAAAAAAPAPPAPAPAAAAGQQPLAGAAPATGASKVVPGLLGGFAAGTATAASTHPPALPLLQQAPGPTVHSPVPADLFEGDEYPSPLPPAPLLVPAQPHLGSGAGDTPGAAGDAPGVAGDPPSAPAFDLLSVRPDLALPENVLDLLEELLVALGDPALDLVAELLVSGGSNDAVPG